MRVRTPAETIRAARPGDLALLPAIERSAASLFKGCNVPAWLLTDASPAEHWQASLNGGTLWVAEIDDRLVAYLAASAWHERLHIEQVDVARAYQRRGLGRRLLLTAQEWARAEGSQTMSLTTFRHIPWNAPFYASLGFHEWPIGSLPDDIRQRLDYEAAMGLNDRCAMRLDL